MKVLIVEDEPLFRALLETSLRSQSIEVTASISSAEEALTLQLDPDTRVAIIDYVLGDGMDGIIVGNTLMERHPALSCILLTANTSAHLTDRVSLTNSGKWSVVRKHSVGNVEELAHVINIVAEGETVFQTEPVTHLAQRLSATQRRALEYVAAGASNTAIARRLNISVRSVEGHISRAFVLLGIDASDPEINPRVVAAARLLTDDMLSS